MPHKRVPRTPSLRLHKHSGRAFVEIEGVRYYLGKHGTPETRQAYDEAIAEWLVNGRRMPVSQEELTVIELCARYMSHARRHYRKPDGTPTSELRNIAGAMRELRTLYGTSPVVEFDPLKLKIIQSRFVEAGHTRKTVNHYTAITRRIFKWGSPKPWSHRTSSSPSKPLRGYDRGGARLRKASGCCLFPSRTLRR